MAGTAERQSGSWMGTLEMYIHSWIAIGGRPSLEPFFSLRLLCQGQLSHVKFRFRGQAQREGYRHRGVRRLVLGEASKAGLDIAAVLCEDTSMSSHGREYSCRAQGHSSSKQNEGAS
jgi:hypothetical protein